ncbi:unnamed protein product [Rotaria sordida]|uniref:Uncharacterized protein n=1 Tax=Rotaria sordida TaxID=392033 RepID=A0A815F3W7_9BILA|nr:unnamed protein product [Rotaria sordida]CAF1582250.1 unnamed protein product [Rotaria sordida]
MSSTTEYVDFQFFINIPGGIERNLHPPYVFKYMRYSLDPRNKKKQIINQKKLLIYAIPIEVHLRYKTAQSKNDGYKFSLTITDNNGIKLKPNLPINLSKTDQMKMHQSKMLNTFFMKILNNEEESDDEDDDKDISF